MQASDCATFRQSRTHIFIDSPFEKNVQWEMTTPENCEKPVACMGFLNEKIDPNFYNFIPFIPDPRLLDPDSEFTWEKCFRELGIKPWWDLVAESPTE